MQNIQLSKINLGGFAPQTPCSLTRRGPKARLRSLAKTESPFAALKPRNRLRPRLVGAPQERRAAGRSRQQPSDGRRRRETRQPHSLAEKLSKSAENFPVPAVALVRASLSLVHLRPSGFGGQPSLSWPANRSSPSCGFLAPHFGGAKVGGEYRSRTGDLLVANQALSQLS